MKGYAFDPEWGMWLGHWWCVDADNRVVDPTWKNSGTAYVALEVLTAKECAERTLGSNAWELEVAQVAPPSLQNELDAFVS